MTKTQLRLIAEGCAPEDVDFAVDIKLIDEGAYGDSIKLKYGSKSKEALEYLKSAEKKIKSDDRAGAKKDLDKAIKAYEDLKTEAKDIDDDNIFVNALRAGVTAGAVYSLATIAGVVLGIPSASLAGYFIGYITGIYPTLEYNNMVLTGKSKANKAGKNGTTDIKQWWRVGVSRANATAAFDRHIAACKKLKSEL